MEIQIKRRLNHNRMLIYICDPKQRVAVEVLTGKKTVTEKDVTALTSLGFHIYDCDLEIKKLWEV